MRDTILFGDCRQTLKEFDEKARMCVTSPPYYGLRDYGGEDSQIGQEQTPEEFIDELVKVFREVRNVLTDDGTCWVNLGDSYYNYRPGKGQGLVNKQSQILSKTYQMCVLAEEIESKDSRKRPYWNPMALCLRNESRWMVSQTGYNMA